MSASRSFLFGLGLSFLIGLSGCHRHTHAPPDFSDTQEPDKILYEKSLEDIENKRYDVARLTLQTLINTYPDSDYLADAKLAIADSYYEQGGSGPLTHAEVEYKDFITFFPNHPRVPEAQYRAAMTHYRQLEKPDRDPTHARRAEHEFQLLLRHYPDSEFVEDGRQKLVEVQEVLAEGQFRVGHFYYIKSSWWAAASRLMELVDRYPNYSQRDKALWMLGKVFQKNQYPLWEADADRAADYLARLVEQHPLSDYLDEAKAELRRLGHPVPQPDPKILARAHQVTPIGEMQKEERSLLSRLITGHIFRMVRGRPDTSDAAPYLGPPPLEHEDEVASLPPPRIYVKPAKSEVAVQTVEGVPTAGADGEPEGQTQQARNEPEKKSFWRKLIPFY